MSEYQVIARKYRPLRFSDVVGQDHVVQTLRNAIRQNRTAHAYLFVGPRGVGKTTLARIFAKAMNCENPKDGEPCCECRSCRAIASESSLDIIEIDAASHNSAGEMRELADEVLHMPVASRYKIYIIDEVHMLSNQAWNALLKTVEEPPAHVKFIFATTEVHKVLPTIISRCQRFDLMPIQTRVIAKRLSEIAANEKIAIDPGAIDAIARAADGGMRDAQSLLDQMFAFFAGDAEKSISASQVLSLFGLTDSVELDAILTAMLANRPPEILTAVHALSVKGKNLETLFDDITSALRAIQICMLLDDPASVLDESPENIERFRRLGGLASRETVGILLETLAPVGRILHDALNKQVFLETILLKAMREAHAVRISDLVARLNQLRGAGELRFLDHVPPPQSLPPPAVGAPPEASATPAAPSVPVVAPSAPDAVPETMPESAAVAETVEPKAEPVAVPAPKAESEPASLPPPMPPEIADDGANPAPEAPELTPEQRLAELVAGCRDFPPKVARVMACGHAVDFRDGVLTVEFPITVKESDVAYLQKGNASLNKLFRSLNSDLECSVLLKRAESYEIPPPQDEPAEVVVNTVPADAVEPAVAAAAPMPENFDLEEPEDTPPAPPPFAPAGPVEDAPGNVLPEHCVGVSVMNDERSRSAALSDPAVQNLLNLFGGSLADIHIDKTRKGK